MAEDLQITKSEFTEILKNRGKQVSSGTDDDTLLKKVNYLKKQDLVHLATIRGLVFSESSLVNYYTYYSKMFIKRNNLN